jgi:hypothetical protein
VFFQLLFISYELLHMNSSTHTVLVARRKVRCERLVLRQFYEQTDGITLGVSLTVVASVRLVELRTLPSRNQKEVQVNCGNVRGQDLSGTYRITLTDTSIQTCQSLAALGGLQKAAPNLSVQLRSRASPSRCIPSTTFRRKRLEQSKMVILTVYITGTFRIVSDLAYHAWP